MASVPEMMMQYGYFAPDSYQPDVAAMCLDAAKAYLDGAGVPTPAPDDAAASLYDTACYMLAMHWYDNRGVVSVGAVQGPIQMGIQAIIWQLAGSGGR